MTSYVLQFVWGLSFEKNVVLKACGCCVDGIVRGEIWLMWCRFNRLQPHCFPSQLVRAINLHQSVLMMTHKRSLSIQQNWINTADHQRAMFYTQITLSFLVSYIRRGHRWSKASKCLVWQYCDIMLSMSSVPTTPVLFSICFQNLNDCLRLDWFVHCMPFVSSLRKENISSKIQAFLLTDFYYERVDALNCLQKSSRALK